MQSIALCPDDVPRPRAPIPLASQIAAVQRELALRATVYPVQVARGRMTQTRADYHMATMEAVLVTLQRVQEAQRASIEAVYP